MNKPFYTSRKFAYALVTFVAVLLVTFLPSLLGLDEEAASILQSKIDFLFYFGFALIGGHTLMDALTMAAGQQLPTLTQAVDDVKEAITGATSQ